MASMTIAILVASGGTALVVTLVIGAFGTAGVIDMPTAIGMLALAWIVGAGAIFTSDHFREKPQKWPMINMVIASAILAIMLMAIGFYINKHRPQAPGYRSLIDLTNVELRDQAQHFVTEFRQFGIDYHRA